MNQNSLLIKTAPYNEGGYDDLHMNAACTLDTKNEKTLLTTRAQVHHIGESRKFDSTLPDVDC